MDDDPDTTRLAAGESASVTVKPITSGTPLATIARSPSAEMIGAAFTGYTVTKKLELDELKPSLAVSVIIAFPD